MAYREDFIGGLEQIAFGTETTYGTRVAPTKGFGRNTEFDMGANKNTNEPSIQIARETMFKDLPVKTMEEHGGGVSFDLIYGVPLKFIGSGVFDRQIGGAGSNYNHVVDFLSKTLSTFSLDDAKRHTNNMVFQYISMYPKSLIISGTPSEFVRCSLDCGAYSDTIIGTATSGGATTLVDTGQAWTTDEYSEGIVVITSGTGAGQSRSVTSNTSNTLTVPAWTTNPDSTSTYKVGPSTNPPAIDSNTSEPMLMSKSSVTVENTAVAEITGLDLTVTRDIDEQRHLSSYPHLQTEPSVTGYSVSGNFKIKVTDTTFWNYFAKGELLIEAIAEMNYNNVVFQNSTYNKLVVTLGDIKILNDPIPTARDNVLTQTLAFEAYKQKTAISSTADGNTTNEVVDSGVTFPVGSEGAFIHNTTDDTWAVVLERVTANRLYCSADVCPDGNEAYDLFRPAVSIMSVDQLTTH